MGNPNKKKGTAAETKVVKYLESQGIKAYRKVLHGSKDEGDIELPVLNICLEVKAGKQTQDYNRKLFQEWLDQALTESYNAGEPCYLVIVRFGKSIQNAEVWSKSGLDGGLSFWFLDNFCTMLNSNT